MDNKEKSILLKVLGREYKIRKDFPYSMLAEILPPNILMDFLSCFGGSTFYVPTINEMAKLTKACLIFELGGYDTALKICKEATNGISRIEYDALVVKFDC